MTKSNRSTKSGDRITIPTQLDTVIILSTNFLCLNHHSSDIFSQSFHAAHSLPFSQPRQIFGGHLVSTSTALIIWNIFGKTYLSIGLTLAIVLFLIITMKLIHPPAAASAMVAINTEAGWGFLVSIILSSFDLYFSSL